MLHRDIERTPEDQQRVDTQTSHLVMYESTFCPYCFKTRRAIRRLSLHIESRNGLHDETSRRELQEGGGRVQVPCLRITHEDGRVEWLYESDDIVAWLEQRFA